MSRYVLRRDGTYEVCVGWDDPLGTFFSQVYGVKAGLAAEDDVLIAASGVEPGEVTDVNVLLASVEQYAPCPPGAEGDRARLIERLNGDKVNRQLPTEFQRATFNALTGEELP